MLESPIEEARQAALEVLRHNLHGPYDGLPRTAAWGYPEPYTRDLMISALGILTTDDAELIDGIRRTLLALAEHQTPRGHIPSLAHNALDRGASDTTPLFLLALAIYRQATGEARFLDEAAELALTWMDYQSPEDLVIVAQQPTSDWRDEQWVLGYGLYVNALVYTYLCLYGRQREAGQLSEMLNKVDVRGDTTHGHRHEGLVVTRKPYYALWSYKILHNERFDLLGNSLAILSGIAAPSRAREMVDWIESECTALQLQGDLVLDLPPCLFPYSDQGAFDWHPRMEILNRPGEYHNGGVWPFVAAFYVAALVAAGRPRLAERKLTALVELVRPAREHALTFGFNEWLRAQDGTPRGQDWQTWSAAMYLYAAAAVEKGQTPFFDRVRDG